MKMMGIPEYPPKKHIILLVEGEHLKSFTLYMSISIYFWGLFPLEGNKCYPRATAPPPHPLHLLRKHLPLPGALVEILHPKKSCKNLTLYIMQTTKFWRVFSGHELGESMQNHLFFCIFDHPKGNCSSKKITNSMIDQNLFTAMSMLPN